MYNLLVRHPNNSSAIAEQEYGIFKLNKTNFNLNIYRNIFDNITYNQYMKLNRNQLKKILLQKLNNENIYQQLLINNINNNNIKKHLINILIQLQPALNKTKLQSLNHNQLLNKYPTENKQAMINIFLNSTIQTQKKGMLALQKWLLQSWKSNIIKQESNKLKIKNHLLTHLFYKNYKSKQNIIKNIRNLQLSLARSTNIINSNNP